MPFGGDLFPEHERIPKVIAGIQKEDQKITPDLGSHMQQRHGLSLERRTQSDLRPEHADSPPNDFLRRLRLEFLRELLNLERCEHRKIIPVIPLTVAIATGVSYNHSMDSSTAQRLIELNREFYARFGESFSATRHRIQPGVRRVLGRLNGDESILDLGCGNGELARELAKGGHRGPYLGLDFSLPLLREAEGQFGDLLVRFIEADLTQLAVISNQLFVNGHWSVVAAFAVLHHIPSQELRLNILRVVKQLVKADGLFIHSNWQYLNSEKLKARIQPWEAASISARDVDPGDYLLDWRSGGKGLRYVHHFDEQELDELARTSGFQVIDTFYSDGEGGQLGLYQVWKPVS
jgi:tRNA (uracil-5-)-methyltransferase TRM9